MSVYLDFLYCFTRNFFLNKKEKLFAKGICFLLKVEKVLRDSRQT